jgi:hypothetical protein
MIGWWTVRGRRHREGAADVVLTRRTRWVDHTVELLRRLGWAEVSTKPDADPPSGDS